MKIGRVAAGASMLSLGLMLAACGGGGGVGSTPNPGTPTPTTPTPTTPTPTTPTPTTPTPTPAGANDDLLAPLVSETFKTQGITATAKYSTSGGFVNNPAASKLAINFSYNSSNKSYSITVGGRSQTFRESDIDNSLSTAQLTVYVRESDDRIETLTLTKAGTSGEFTYQYVGGGFWERATLNSSTIDATADAFTYGIETANSSVPRTGGASYDINIIGVHPTPFGAQAVAGSGFFNVDFARGTFALRGNMTGTAMPVTEFVGDGRLSASTNGFSGEIRFNADGRLNRGSLDGKFYGPSGQELGAVWKATPSGMSSSDSLYTGVLLGRQSGSLAAPGSFAAVNSDLFLSGMAARIQKNGSGAPTTNANLPVTVHYDAASGVYTVFDPDRSYYGGVDFTYINEADETPGDNLTIEAIALVSSLDYVRSGVWSRRQYRNGVPNFQIENFVFGFPTANSAVPRSGSGMYDIDISATLMRNGTPGMEDEGMSGRGQFLADFASGDISLTGSINLFNQGTGAFEGEGSISSSANAFSGDFDISTPLDGDFANTFNGMFYGPAGQELGATFTGSGGAGKLSGSFIGSKTGSVPAGAKPLSAYTDPLTLSALYSRGIVSPTRSPVVGAWSIVWNPDEGAYRLRWDEGPVDITMGAAQRDAGASTSRFDVYSATSGFHDYTARVYKTGNPEIALTYTSFIEFQQHDTSPSNNRDVFWYSLIGTPTPAHQMPKFGSATYSGVAYGTGVTTFYASGVNPLLYALTGTSEFSVNFQNGDMDGSITLSGIEQGGSTKNFGSWQFDGHHTEGAIFNLQDPNQFNGFYGYFFGPNAAEYSAVFDIQASDADSITKLVGVTLGKQN